MKEFYDNHDKNLGSKITEHEFDIIPGAWDDMEKKLDSINKHYLISNLYGTWAIIALLFTITAVCIYYYQSSMPFGKLYSNILNKNPELTKTKSPDKYNDIKTSERENNPSEIVKSNFDNYGTSKSNVSKTEFPNNPPNTQTIREESNKNKLKLNPKSENLVNENFEKIIKKVEISPLIPEEKPSNSKTQNSQVYTKRKTAVFHTFSESFVRDLIEAKKVSSGKGLIEKNVIDTPIIVLENPYLSPKKNTKFGISAGINTKINKDGKFSIAPTLGLLIRKKIESCFAVQAELQYKTHLKSVNKNRPGHRDLLIQIDVDPSDEVNMVDRSAKVYEIKRMQLLELPISFIYTLNKKHNFTMGINAAYLFSVKSNNIYINKMKLKQLGFNSFDLGALAGYEYNFNENISLGLFCNLGFLNLARNSKNSQQSLQESNSSYQVLENETNGDNRLIPIEINSNEQILFENPGMIYNTDLKLLMRYLF